MTCYHYDPPVPHTMSSWMIEELERGHGRPGVANVFILVEVGFPTRTFRFAKAGTGSATYGNYEGRLISAGSMVRAVQERTSGLIDQEIEVEVSDAGDKTSNRRQLASEFAKKKNQMGTVTVKVWLASGPDMPQAGWSLRFNGYMVGLPRQPSPTQWRIRARPNDTVVRYGSIPRRKVTKQAWPNVHSSAELQYQPLVYGSHRGASLGDEGALPTLYLDTNNFLYGWGLGGLTATVPTVYENGTATGASYALSALVDGEGNIWSIIDFATDRGTATITVDADGFTPNSDGTGTAITNPVLQLQHLLTNYVFNDRHAGAYYADSTVPLDFASWARMADYMAARNHQGTLYLGGASGASDLHSLLSDFADQYWVRFYWTNNGTLAICPAPVDPYITSRMLYSDEQWLKADELAVSPPALDYDEQGIVREVVVSYGVSVNQSKLYKDMKVQDITVPQRVGATLDFNLSAAKV